MSYFDRFSINLQKALKLSVDAAKYYGSSYVGSEHVLFGILKAGIILGLLIMVFEALNSSIDLVERSMLDDSKVYTALREMAESVFPSLKSLAADIKI